MRKIKIGIKIKNVMQTPKEASLFLAHNLNHSPNLNLALNESP